MRFLVVGAGGHSREVADLLTILGHSVSSFFSDSASGVHRPTGVPIVPDWSGVDAEAATVAIGDPHVRARMFDRLMNLFDLPALIHPSACVSAYADVGHGTQVMQNVVVNSTAVVGENVILNVACFVAHDCVVGAHTHVAPGALLSGGSHVGDRCVIGAGAVVLPGVKVGSCCTVGAGAVVTRDVTDGITVVGVPARSAEETDR